MPSTVIYDLRLFIPAKPLYHQAPRPVPSFELACNILLSSPVHPSELACTFTSRASVYLLFLDVGDSYRRPGHSIALVALQLLQLFADLTAVHQLDRGGQSMGGASTSPAQHPAAASSASSGGIVGIQRRHRRHPAAASSAVHTGVALLYIPPAHRHLLVPSRQRPAPQSSSIVVPLWTRSSQRASSGAEATLIMSRTENVRPSTRIAFGWRESDLSRAPVGPLTESVPSRTAVGP
mmetsp:Transcript_14673/g.29430  ORF Transcript_14673/g.29430 Transcript_14673/m.29430 type:complete len:236 (-) Transcript_14673:152-859(-)